MKSFYVDKFQYQYDSNAGIIDLLKGYGARVPKNAKRWLSHIFNAQEIWNSRILGREWKFDVWQIHPETDWHQINTTVHQDSINIISSQPLDREITYLTTEGIKYSSRLDKILYHIVNHGTYHRGQIAYELREKGLEPIGTDYIFYTRS